MKKWYRSRTLWVNAIAGIAAIVVKVCGFEIGAEEQVGILALVNVVLRAVTKTGLEA